MSNQAFQVRIKNTGKRFTQGQIVWVEETPIETKFYKLSDGGLIKKADCERTSNIMQPIPLYCIIARTGDLFSVHYHGQENMKSERTGYNVDTFDGCPNDCPVIDYRTAKIEDMMHKVIDRCSGTIEEQAQPYDHEARFLKSPMFSPVPFATLLEYAKEAGATITTVGELRA